MRTGAWPPRWRWTDHAWRLGCRIPRAALALRAVLVPAAVLVLAAVLLSTGAWAVPGGARAAGNLPAGGRTVVTFTFDDGDADQLAAARVLHAHRMRGTFYIITGAIGTPAYLTVADLRRLAAAGHEIGAHSVSHLNLTRLGAAEARRQVCMSRDILAGWGFRVTSFAYPGAAANRAAKATVRGCGFTSARIAGGLRTPGCPGCAAAETIPPAHRYAIRTPGQAEGSWTLADMQRTVVTAERLGGGWVPFVFHHVCTTGRCPDLAVKLSTLKAFTSWLAQRQRTAGTVVRTVAEVVGGPARPPVRAGAAAPHGVRNPSLETVGHSATVDPLMEALHPDAFLSCWMRGGYGNNTVRWHPTRAAHSGRWAQSATITRYAGGDAKLLQRFDLGACSLPVASGTPYQLGTWYQATARTQYAVYYRTPSGKWAYWRSSPFFPASSRWAQAVWQTPPVPADATGLSYGLTLSATGTLTTDDYTFGPASPGIARLILDSALLASVPLIALIVAVRRITRRRRRAPAGGSAPQTTRPPASSGRPAS
jgi:peptidoglycan/xylan/chitin deacetylase (PgdA/CDA1 family)